MIIVLEEQIGTTELAENVIQVYETNNFNVPSGITVDILTEEGQLITALSANTPLAIAAPTANNQTLVSDLSVAGKWKIGASAGGGGGQITLTNKDSANALSGSVVIADLANDKAFLGTAVPNHLGAIGVLAEDININASGKVNIAALATTLVSGNVKRGEWLVTSATKWRGKTAGYNKPLYGTIGYALTEYSGGGNGTVDAVVMPEPRHLTTAGTAWALGGSGTDAQKFTLASATWMTIAGAALDANTTENGGLGYGTTAGYSIGGYQTTSSSTVVTAYKMPFATEVTSTQSSANLGTATRLFSRGNLNGSDRGYLGGGYTNAYVGTCWKLTYSTDTMSSALGTSLSVARHSIADVSDGSTGYVQGGYNGSVVGTSDKVTFATDTFADNNSGDVTAERYSGVSFPGTDGHISMKNGATALSKKITFSTGVSANVTSTVPADQQYAVGITDGSGLAWFSGDDASPYSVSHKFTKATETYAADAGAVMAVGKSNAACFNNGAY
jgi:hypothetical protein